MTATLILMTSAFVAGGDCGGCAAPAASCNPCARVSCMDKMRARMALWSQKKGDSCCDPCAKPAPAPTCCTPAPAPACKTECAPKCRSFKKHDCGCDPCAKPSLLDRLKARFHKNDCCETKTDCCGAAPAAPAAAPATMPAPAPKPIPPTGKTTKLVVPSEIVPTSGNSF